jgi:hypothetical protein
MMPKTSIRGIQPDRPLVADDLRRVFENAVSSIHEADLAVKKRLKYRTPIFQRRDILGSSQGNTEKRALTDAARALAQLWKV